MMGANATVEKAAIGKGSKFFRSVRTRDSFMFDYPERKRSENVKSQDRKDLSDEELVKLFLENEDEEAFNEIVDRYGDKIYRLAMRVTRNHSDAEEVLQEVFITVIKKLGTFREESKFSTWLYRVAVNAGYMRLRSERKRHENETNLRDYAPYDEYGALRGVQLKDWSDIPGEVTFDLEGMEVIEKAVNWLPEHYRVVFHLRDVEGFTNQEVAKILGLSLPAVKSRVHRARLFLRDRLSDYFYEWRACC